MKLNYRNFRGLMLALTAFYMLTGLPAGAQIIHTFTFTGSPQTFIIPPAVTTITVDLRGGAGANSVDKLSTNAVGGAGGRALGVMTVTPGQVLNIYVGGAGSTNGTGGFNGGGAGGSSSAGSACSGGPAGGGGGASDIRIAGIALTDRVIVAGGGGASGRDYCNGGCQPCGCGGSGGSGGGLTGGSGSAANNCGFSFGGSGVNGAIGGSSSAGGAGGAGDAGGAAGSAGTSGNGGQGAAGSYDVSGGGGGGGYYGGGGGGGAAGGNGTGGGGGAGGSSYANSSFVSNVIHTQGFQAGDGLVVISYDEATTLGFDGSNDFIAVGASSLLNANGAPVTLEAWVNPTSTTSVHSIIRKDGDYNLYITAGALAAEFFTGGTNFRATTSASSLQASQWSHVAAVWNGTNCSLYVNGNAVSTTSYNSTASATANLQIGRSAIYGEPFSGKIDEMRIWKRALCLGEIQNNRMSEISVPQTSLVAYYKFNHGVPSGSNTVYTTLSDATANALHGTLNNFALTGTTSNWLTPGAVVTGSLAPAFTSPVIVVNSGTICSGASFTIVPSGAASYTYSSGSNVIAPSSNTVINVTGTNSLGCIASNTAASSITVHARPAITVNSGTICAGQSFTLLPSGASTYTYSGGSVVSPVTSASYSVTGTSTAGCLSTNTAVSSVVVNTVPVISVNSGSMCTGKSFTITPSGAATFTVSGGSFTVAPSTSTSYNVSGTSPQGCASTVSAVSSITVNTTPTISVNSGTICSGKSFTMSGAGASTYTYAGGSAIVSPLTNTVYNVTGTSAQGCVGSNTAVSSITVYTTPTVAVNSGSICAGRSFTMTGTGAFTYTYSGGTATVSPANTTTYGVTGTSSMGCISSNTAVSSVVVNTVPVITVNSGSICTGNSFTIIPAGAGTYTISGGASIVSPLTNTVYNVTGTSAQGCVGSNTAVSNVTVHVTPTIAVNSGSICSGNSFTIVASGAGTYTYSGGAAVVAPVTSTVYNVTGTSAQGCIGSNTAVSNVTVYITPTITVNSGSICTGESFTILPGGAATYTISGGSATVSPVNTSSYNVTGTSSMGCVSSNTAVSDVTVHVTPTIAVTSGSICSGNVYTIVASGAASYTFSGGSATVSPAADDSYTVTGTSAEGCAASNTAISTVSVYTTPTVAVNSGSICEGQSFTLVPSGAATFTFINGGAVVSPTVTTSYSVAGTSSMGCITASEGVGTVTVYTTPTVAVNSGTICEGQTFTIMPSGADAYTISGGIAVVSPTITTSYSVTGESTVGCGANSAAVNTVVVNALPVVTAVTGSSVICEGETATLTASGASTLVWDNAVSAAVQLVTPSVTTTFTVTGTDANGCQSSASVTQVVDACTGISGKAPKSVLLKIYPNPNNGTFFISTDAGTHVDIMNELGQVVRVLELQAANNYHAAVSGLANGIYFVVCRYDGKLATEKIIVEN